MISSSYVHYRHYDADEQEDLAVEAQMYDLKHDAMERISKIVHPHYEDQFIQMLIFGIDQNEDCAENIARELGLHQGHLLAIQGNFVDLKQYLRDVRREDKMMSYSSYFDDLH